MQNHSTNLAINPAAWFFIRESDSKDGCQQQLPLNVPFSIGRDPKSTLYLKCASVSGTHAEIVEEGGQLWIKDLNSTNGTFLNGQRVNGQHTIGPDDTVQFGTAVFHISAKSDNNDQINQTTNGSDNERFQALLKGGVVPFYQPVVRLDSPDTIVGYEVFGRSRLFGLRTPAQMFAAASGLEMEAELSRALRKKGIEVADQRLPADATLFVNTHAAELQTAGLEESLFEIRDLYPNRPIMLEINEAVLEDAQRFLKLRSTLENIDVQLAFHDFGSSQIRLAELCEVLPELVKFDVELIRGIHLAGERRQRFVASLIKMLNDLGITPLAECIEEAGERDTLRQLGFKLGQGFLFGKPSSLTENAEPIENAGRDEVSSRIAFDNSLMDGIQPDVINLSNADFYQSNHKGSQWLLAQPAQAYTVQVLSAISEDRALEHVAQQDNPADFAIFCKQGKTRKLYIVVHGVFADRGLAKEASKKLASAVVSPWIRMMSSIHDEIRNAGT